MKRRLLVLLCGVLLAPWFQGCATPPAHSHPAPLHHIVLCWLKNSGQLKDRAKIIEVSRSFCDIPGVVDVRAGAVLPSERAIVDSSFDVAIVMRFKTEADMKAYVDHPAHVKAVQEVLRPLVRKIVVYDFVEEDT